MYFQRPYQCDLALILSFKCSYMQSQDKLCAHQAVFERSHNFYHRYGYIKNGSNLCTFFKIKSNGPLIQLLHLTFHVDTQLQHKEETVQLLSLSLN